ncbi:splicing factor, Prp19-binding domain-containing protein [Aspergillus coremiiformis]|uniref:Splicing factor, Prp19-binding domain-containing protein n=1 Tax=Aspergillus coremiiformis TaxID=138285 RepID=A0A5N6YWL9_9EURO|nr:splicing factor, Prp19-binding domain-containing protein [Aspergillus coremiiformis]
MPPLPSHPRGMTANPLKPSRYRPGKPIAEEHSSSEEEEDEEEEARIKEQERRRLEQQRRQRAQAPKATSFPAGSITKGVKDVQIEEDEDEEGFVTEEEEEPTGPRVAGDKEDAMVAAPVQTTGEQVSEEESEEEESSDEEESSSEEEAPRVLLRPTFIKKDKRNNTADQTQNGQGAIPNAAADSAAEAEARRAQRQEKADMLVREQLEKDAIARSAANKQWDDDELEAVEEGGLDDKDGADPEAEYAAWKLRELKRIKREREAIEAAEKEREEVERRRNLTAEEREREDREFIAKQQEEREATRSQGGFMQRYFHKGAFFRDDLEKEGLDRRNVMGARFVDDVSRETLPEYMQIRDMTKLGKKGRTRYKDLKSEDTGRFGNDFDHRRRRDAPIGVRDERFMPDHPGDRPKGPTGANAGPVRERRRSRSRSHSPRRDQRHDRRERRESPGRDRSRDRYRPDTSSRRKRSPSPYEDREKRRRMRSVS